MDDSEGNGGKKEDRGLLEKRGGVVVVIAKVKSEGKGGNASRDFIKILSTNGQLTVICEREFLLQKYELIFIENKYKKMLILRNIYSMIV